METAIQKEFLKSTVRGWKSQGKSIGFVPTMGALHQGHLDLIRQARRETDKVVVSIFVNPLQFNNPLDLEKYPRSPEADADLLASAGVDLLFLPEPASFYPAKPLLSLDFGPVSRWMEGEMRPGHFSGVGIVVARLFHLVEPDKAFFGEKDLQQVAVVRCLVRDLDFPVEVVRCPTTRESSGLAMSSRNARLSEEGRAMASHLYECLLTGAEKARVDPAFGKKAALEYLANFPEIQLEYLDWVNSVTMEPWDGIQTFPEEAALCLAAWVEGVRLIDNLVVSGLGSPGNTLVSPGEG